MGLQRASLAWRRPGPNPNPRLRRWGRRRAHGGQGGNLFTDHGAGRFRMGSMAAPRGAHAGSTKGYGSERSSQTSRCSSGMSGGLIRGLGRPLQGRPRPRLKLLALGRGAGVPGGRAPLRATGRLFPLSRRRWLSTPKTCKDMVGGGVGMGKGRMSGGLQQGRAAPASPPPSPQPSPSGDLCVTRRAGREQRPSGARAPSGARPLSVSPRGGEV